MHYNRWNKAQRRAAGTMGTCSVLGCDREISARGKCSTHYNRALVGNRLETCAVAWCDKTNYARGWCTAHYARWKSHGDPEGGSTRLGEPAAFFEEARRAAPEACCLWPFSVSSSGYALMQRDGKVQLTHRLMCETVHGPPPSPEHQVRHGDCHARRCINPHHLSWGTRAENEADKRRDGTLVVGEAVHFSKLTAAKVKEIRAAKQAGAGAKGLAERYGVSVDTIYQAVNRRTWKHVD